ncbi:MAG: hypothetical protein U9P12_00120 [Verrucomicrobiota bacterium]|nr:hypothetical protein [Verrucomicrobiota bacterium]
MRPEFEVARFPIFGSPFPMAFSTDRDGIPREGGTVCFAWDESGLFVLAEMEDSNLIALNRQDEQLHYATGDVFELFVKPLNDSFYWEMYATPKGNKSTLFFPRDRSGMELNDFLHGHAFQSLEVSVEGTSNGWSTQMFVPVSQLTALGAGWGDGTEWTVFCGRYNYNSEDLSAPELSMAPALSATNYHLTNEYALLRLCES